MLLKNTYKLRHKVKLAKSERRSIGRVTKNVLKVVCSLVFSVFIFCPVSHAAGLNVANSPLPVRVAFFPNKQSIQKLANGGTGDGYIVFYLKTRGLMRPGLIVHLVHPRGSNVATADVYQAPINHDYISYSIKNDTISLPDTMKPAIVMTSLDGRWIINGHADVNLHVVIYSPFRSMWEVADIAKLIYPKGRPKNAPRLPIYTIDTRANSDGTPEWDLRQLVPTLPSEGVYRTNYAQRMKLTPLKWAPSVTAIWPYIAVSGNFTQPYGVEVPPIVVNWDTGRVLDFSEVVSVRAESNGYALYSLNPLNSGEYSTPNFESPWGFYNLSGKSSIYPNLIIRTQHNYANDPYYRSYGSASLLAPLYPFQSEDIRYSWANHVGDEHFNYKLDVYGTAPYVQKTSIASGKLTVLAPDFAQYPHFVVSHKWPVATFVDTEGHSYATSEGIYDWPANSVGLPYIRGWTQNPSIKQFQTIRSGFRGEYRVGPFYEPKLYLSPIDHQWHLLDAEAGLWNLGNGYQIQERNLTGGQWIDDWSLSDAFGVRTEEFAHLDGWSIYTGPQGATWVKDARPSSSLEVAPPTDHASWDTFVHKTPNENSSWSLNLNSLLPTGTKEISGLEIQDLKATKNGFQFILWNSSFVALPVSISGVSMVTPGPHKVQYDHETRTWRLLPASNPSVELISRSTSRPAVVGVPQTYHFVLKNTGDISWNGYLSVYAGNNQMLGEELKIPGNATVEKDVVWTPSTGGASTLSVRLNNQTIGQSRIKVQPQLISWERQLWGIMVAQGWDSLLTIASLAALLAFAYASIRRVQG